MQYSILVSMVTVLFFTSWLNALAWATEAGSAQTITRAGTHQPAKAPEENFTGQVSVQRLFPANEHAPFTAALVTFQPGARSHWHTHSGGQHLVVTEGNGRTGTADGTVEEFAAGDVLWCPPGIRHWHGAAPNAAMTHMAITGIRDDKSTEWMEPVTDDQYNAK